MSSSTLQGRYDLQQLIEEGPIFSVWNAKDRMGPRDVSVRILRAPFSLEPEFHQALRQAIAEAGPIRHPCLERIFDVSTDDQVVFLVGEPVRGMSLAERIRKLAPFSAPVALGAVITLCEGLVSLHREGIVHGDVGAHNVRVLPEGSAILQQSGLWKAYSASRSAGPTVLPLMAPYLAPEISQGDMPTSSSDVYAVGVTLFQLLTGKSPFEADQPVAQAMKHVSDPIPSVRAVNPTLPHVLDELIAKALSKQRADRYANASQLLTDLRIVKDGIRFGKTLQWPLDAASYTPRPQSGPSMGADEPTKPDRSAVTRVPTEDKAGAKADKKAERLERKRAKREASVSDVPNWLKGTLVFSVALLAMMVGAWVISNLSKPKLVVAPDIQRVTISKAEQTLKPLKLKLRVVKKVYDEKIPADTIVDMDPTPGERIYEGGVINVKVSAGSRFVETPDLRGTTVDKARLLLDSLGLKLDDDISQERSTEAPKGMILRQTPEARSRVERRTAIHITMSSGPDGRQSARNDGSKYMYTVHIELSDITEAVLMRVDMTDARGTRTISEENREPGEVVDLTAEGFGNEATFKVFYNGDPVTQVTKKADETERI